MIETFKEGRTTFSRRAPSACPPKPWRRRENTNIAKLIAHLAEMSARKTALELGYKSLYDYCIKHLNLSEGAVASSRSNEMGKKDEPAQSRYVASEVSERVHERGSYRINACFWTRWNEMHGAGGSPNRPCRPVRDLSQQLRVHSSDFVPSTQSNTGRTCLRAGVHPAQD